MRSRVSSLVRLKENKPRVLEISMSIRVARLMTLAAIALMASFASAQDRYLAEMYGEGVHAVYRGNSSAADRSLSRAIDGGFEDARAYYFRAINKMLRGDTGGAESDIRMGAEQEVNGRGSYNIGLALERVQGPHRIRFERVRRDALIMAQRAKAWRAKNAPDNAYDRDYLREPKPNPVDVIPGVPPAPAADDPFMGDDDEMKPADPMDDDDELEEPMEDDSDDVMSDDSEDPFTDDEPAADDEDPFAEDDMGDSDDFGDDPTEDMSGDDDFGDDAFSDDDVGGEDLSGDDMGGDDFGADDTPAEVDDLGGDDLDGDSPFGDDDALEAPSDDAADELDSLFDE